MRREESMRVLGLADASSLDEVKRAKRNLLLRNHPDLNPRSSEAAQRRTREILEAYDALMRTWEEPAPLGSPAPRPSPQSSSASSPEAKLYVFFVVAGYSLALDASHVLEVVPLSRLLQEGGQASLPNRVVWRNRSTILLDPRRALRLEGYEIPLRAKVLITSFRGTPAGLIVEETDTARKIPAHEILSDLHNTPFPAGLCAGGIVTEERCSHILVLEKLFTAP